MKKASLTFLFLCTGLGIFAQSGVIQITSGVVEIKPSGVETFVAAKTGDQLKQNTIISTGFRSFAIIEVGSALITVKPLTRLTLTEVETSADAETMAVTLLAGRVRVDIDPPAGTQASMSVMSPMATVSVRGTSFEFDTRNLYVDDGKVNFIGRQGQTIRVGTGANSRVKVNTGVASPMEIRIAELFPPSPAGMNIIGGPVRWGVPFTIGLNFVHE